MGRKEYRRFSFSFFFFPFLFLSFSFLFLISSSLPGSLFVLKRRTTPVFQLLVSNTIGTQDFIIPVNEKTQLQGKESYLIIRTNKVCESCSQRPSPFFPSSPSLPHFFFLSLLSFSFSFFSLFTFPLSRMLTVYGSQTWIYKGKSLNS